MNHTTNYQLNQWEADDQVSRLDFNADNAKIDAALAAKAEQNDLAALTALVGAPLRFASGSYRGTGTSSNTIQMGLSPKFLWIIRTDGSDQRFTYFVSSFEYIDKQGGMGRQTPNSTYTCTPTMDGIKITCTAASSSWNEVLRSSLACNIENMPYAWFAIGT